MGIVRKSRFIGGLAAAAASVFAQTATAAAEPIPIDDLARLPQVRSVSISPEGDALVIMVAPSPDADKMAVSVWDLETSGSVPEIRIPDKDSQFIGAVALKTGAVFALGRDTFNGETWGCDGEASRGHTKTYVYTTVLSDKSLKKFSDPFKLTGVQRGLSGLTVLCMKIAARGDLLSDSLPLDPENVIAIEFDTRGFRVEYKTYNLKTGKTKLLFKGNDSDTPSYLDRRDGTLWAREKVEPRDGKYYFETAIRDAEKGSFSVHDALTTDSSKRNSVYIVGRDEETGKFYITTDKFRDLAAIYLYDPDARTFDEKPVFAHEKFPADSVIFGRTEEDFNDVLGYSYFAETVQVEWIDPYFKSIQTFFETEFPGQYVAIEDYTNDKRKVVVSVQDGSASLAYYLVVDGSDIIKIGDAAPWIDPGDVGRTELVYYRARDGLNIPALLTRPAGWKQGDKPSPAIVLPHGGPWSRDVLGWDDTGWIPFFSSRGYAVLQPQYRGSANWGNYLWRAGDAEWGLKMQDDKDDGANWMIEQGIAAPEEISIFGYSYGGFAAFAAAVRPDGPFRCAIAGAGVADLEKLGYEWSDSRLQRIYQGQTVRGMDPQKNTDNISIPILMFTGDRDVRVPPWHSENFYRRIEGRVPAELVMIEDMPHQFPWRRGWKKQVLEATERFMKAHCGMN